MATVSNVVQIRLSDADLARLDELRPQNCSRGAYIGLLIREAHPIKVEATHDESIQLLAESARTGHVQAQIALERALRATLKQEDEVGAAIEKLLANE